MMSFPRRLNPAHIWMLLQSGVLDVGALLCYAAVLLVIGLIIWRIVKRNEVSAYVLLFVAAALGLTLAFSHWPSNVPPLYADFSESKIITPSREFADRFAETIQEDTMNLTLDTMRDERASLLDANLTRISAASGGRIRYQWNDNGGPLNPSLYVQIGQATTQIQLDRLLVENVPTTPDERPRVLNVENELLQAAQLLKSQPPLIQRMAGPEDPERPSILMDAVRSVTARSLAAQKLDAPVPDYCTFIIMDNPQQDLTEQQAILLRSYLGRGGRLLLITDYAYGAMPNLNSALEEYGLVAIDGVVFDPGSAMGGHAEYPMPELSSEHVIGRWLQAAGRMPLMPLSHGILVRDIEGVDGVALLTTTDEAYCQLNGVDHASLERGDEDPQGPFCLAAAAQMGCGKVVWIASTDMMTVEADTDVGGANQDLLLASLRWLMDAQAEPIPAHPLH